MKLPRGGDALAVLAARLLQLGVSLATSLAVVWGYGLPSAGTLALAALPGAVASLAIGFGLPSALPRADLDQGARATLGLAVSTAALVPVAALAVAYGHAFGRDGAESLALAALGLAGGLAGQVNVQQTLCVLQDRRWAAPVAPGLHLAGTGLALAAPTFEGFCLALLATRALGCAAGFLPLTYGRVAGGPARRACAEAARYAPLDLVALLAEQLPVVLLAGALTRAELGVFGLLRQFVTVADTPGWSFVFSHYPSLVADPAGAGASLARRNERLAWASSLACLGLSAGLALTVYRVPQAVPALPLVLAAMPARYMNNFCDQALRAAGYVRDCAALAVAKAAISLALFAALASAGGFWGAVAASALLSLAGGLLYRQRFLARFPGTLRPLRPWRLA